MDSPKCFLRLLDRHVIDKTGIMGLFQFSIWNLRKMKMRQAEAWRAFGLCLVRYSCRPIHFYRA